MANNAPVINYTVNEQLPQNRKEIVLFQIKAIRDANGRGSINEEISALIYFIIASMPEIPDDKYDKDRIFKIEPTFSDMKTQYMRDVKMIVPELIYIHAPIIERRRKEKYLRLLQVEAAKVHQLLKIHTNWMFDQDMKLSLGK